MGESGRGCGPGMEGRAARVGAGFDGRWRCGTESGSDEWPGGVERPRKTNSEAVAEDG